MKRVHKETYKGSVFEVYEVVRSAGTIGGRNAHYEEYEYKVDGKTVSAQVLGGWEDNLEVIKQMVKG